MRQTPFTNCPNCWSCVQFVVDHCLNDCWEWGALLWAVHHCGDRRWWPLSAAAMCNLGKHVQHVLGTPSFGRKRKNMFPVEEAASALWIPLVLWRLAGSGLSGNSSGGLPRTCCWPFCTRSCCWSWCCCQPLSSSSCPAFTCSFLLDVLNKKFHGQSQWFCQCLELQPSLHLFQTQVFCNSDDELLPGILFRRVVIWKLLHPGYTCSNRTQVGHVEKKDHVPSLCDPFGCERMCHFIHGIDSPLCGIEEPYNVWFSFACQRDYPFVVVHAAHDHNVFV